MTDELHVTLRETRGTANARRDRNAGRIPAVLYGHGEVNVCLSVPADKVEAAIRQGTRVVDLNGAVSDSALIKDVQWDAFGNDVLHLDLFRVSKDEAILVKVTIETRGDAPGSHEGGIVENVVHQVEIECPANAIPDRLVVNINSLGLGDSISAGVLTLPQGAKLLTDPDTVVVTCTSPAPTAEEEEEGLVTPAVPEPEVIGRKAEEEGED